MEMSATRKIYMLLILLIGLRFAKSDNVIKQGNNTSLCEGKDTFFKDGKCFTLHRQYVTWYEAKDYCEKQGSALATLNSNYLLREVSFPMENDTEIPAWVGAIDITEIGRQIWIANNESVKSSLDINAHNASFYYQNVCLSINENNTIEVKHEYVYCTLFIDAYVCKDINFVTATCNEIGQLLVEGECSALYNDTTFIAKNKADCEKRVLALISIRNREQKPFGDFNSPHDVIEDFKFILITNDAKFESKSQMWQADMADIPNMINRECVLHFIEILLLDVNCNLKTHFICSDFRESPMVITDFSLFSEYGIPMYSGQFELGSNLYLKCLAETFSRPSKLTISNDEGITQAWQENITSLSLVRQKIDCVDIVLYTCELEDILAQRKHRKHIDLWVTGCAPRLCQQQIGGHNVSIGQVINWSLKICILKSKDEKIVHTEILKMKDSKEFPIEYMRKYKDSLEPSERSGIYFTLNLEIFNVSSDDVGLYEVRVHFLRRHYIPYNFTIYAEGFTVKSRDGDLFLQIGIPILITMILTAIGMFCRLRMLKQERVINNERENTDEIIYETTDFTYNFGRSSFNKIPNNDLHETIIDCQVIAENFADTCKYHEKNTTPTLPPRPSANSDYQQIDKSQNIVQCFEISTTDPRSKNHHLNMSHQAPVNVTMINCETKENVLGHDSFELINAENIIRTGQQFFSEPKHYIDVEKVDLTKHEFNNMFLENGHVACGNEHDALNGVRNDCILSGALNANTDGHVYTMETFSNSQRNGCLNNEGKYTPSNTENRWKQHNEIISYHLIGNNYIDHQYLKLNQVIQTGDTLTVSGNAISRGLDKTQTLGDSLSLNDYITPIDMVTYKGGSGYITSVDTDSLMGLNECPRQIDEAIVIGSSDYITPVYTDLSIGLIIPPIYNDNIIQEITEGKKGNSLEACFISSLDSLVFDTDAVASRETYFRDTKNIQQNTGNNSVSENEDAENSKIGDNSYIVFDGAEHIQDGDDDYIVFEGAEHIQDGDKPHNVSDVSDDIGNN